jgi:hypothetical protein
MILILYQPPREPQNSGPHALGILQIAPESNICLAAACSVLSNEVFM